jgi:hypothetical protein
MIRCLPIKQFCLRLFLTYSNEEHLETEFHWRDAKKTPTLKRPKMTLAKSYLAKLKTLNKPKL